MFACFGSRIANNGSDTGNAGKKRFRCSFAALKRRTWNGEENGMQEEILIQLALQAGFHDAAVISTDELYFVPEYRMYCEQNLCGNYNRNYGCPPYSGTPEEMQEKACRYQRALVLKSQSEVEDIYDPAETGALKKEHTRRTLKMIGTLRDQGMEEQGLPIMAGPCNFCDVCKMPEGGQCPHEEYRFSCLSAYCIDVGHLARSCGMEISWNGDVVSFFSMYLFDKKNPCSG